MGYIAIAGKNHTHKIVSFKDSSVNRGNTAIGNNLIVASFFKF